MTDGWLDGGGGGGGGGDDDGVKIWQFHVWLEVQNQLDSFKERMSESLTLARLERGDIVECQLYAATGDRFSL
jgi:hypothetical protein